MNFFLFLLPLTIICHLNQKLINNINKEAKEFNLGETVTFNLYNNNYFKLDYNPENEDNTTVFLTFENGIDLLNLQDPEHNIETIECKYYYETYIMELNLTTKGEYYFEFVSDSNTFDNSFTSFVPGKIIDTINLNQNVYYSKIKIETLSDYQMYSMYKVKDLIEDKYVFFGYEKSFYFDDNYTNPFIICNEYNDDCVKNVKLYKFLKGYEYTIYINFVNLYNTSYYFYFPFLFFPISQNTIKKIEQGYHTSLEPIIYYFNLEKNQNLYSYFKDCQNVFISLTNEEITLDNFVNLDFHEISECEASFSSSNYGIIVAFPKINMYNYITSKVVVADDIIYNVNDEKINIPKGKTKIINLKNNNSNEPNNNKEIKDENPLNLYNILTTYSSPEKNMKFISDVDSNTNYDFLIQNNEYYPIYVEKTSNDININITTLNSKYSFFTAINPALFKMYLLNHIKSSLNLDVVDYNQIFPLNIRLNSNLNIFYDFFNFYFYNFEENIKIYINQLYGVTDLYECDEDLIKNKDLSILRNPIVNCKDKKSAFNRLLSLKDIKLLSGYLSHNSYFDIYLDDDNDNNKIQLSSLSKGINNSTSKYLKKDVIYTIDFTLDHLVKLDPSFNAEISIYNNKDNPIILNSDNPTKEITGNNFKIKASSDAMVYFYGKIFNHIKQIEIKSEEKDKIIQIKSNAKINFMVDIGFKGYNPLNIEIFSNPHIRYNTVIYIENIYKRIENKLVKNEKLYLYYTSKENIEDVEVNIEYINNNIDNPKNEYSLNVIKSNSLNDNKENNLIIDNRYIEYITYRVNFCKASHTVKLFYDGQASNEKLLEFNDTNRAFTKFLDKYGTKLKFDSSQDFVFSYSFKDYTDQLFEKNTKWLEERKELNNLNIKEISLNSDKNLLLIKFYPNYKNSVTKYIIIITSEDNNNTLDTFNNPCYITKLVTERPNGVKIVNMYDIGESDLINAEIDVSDILNKDNKYIVNIISEELRFEKKLNYYTPKSNNKKNNDSDSNSTDNNVAIIIILIVLGIILIILIIILCRFLNKNKRKEKNVNSSQNNTLLLDISNEN